MHHDSKDYEALTVTQDGQLMLAKAERDQVETVWGTAPGPAPERGR